MKLKRKKKKKQVYIPPLYERKEAYFKNHTSFRKRKRWYKKNRKGLWLRFKFKRAIRWLSNRRIRFKMLDFVRWVLVDILRGKGRKHWGIYCYVANPGEGKTISMVAHMERQIKELGRENLYIATNFHYAREDASIEHWVDMIKSAKFAIEHGKYCILAMDEVHITFDATDWKSFPPEMMQLLSFNRKYDLQFICSSQRFERIPKKIVGIANYVVLCKNTLGLDRHFKNYYYDINDYEQNFVGKRSRANFIRTFVTGDDFYKLYDTKRQVERMMCDAEKEKDKRKEAFELLFGSDSNEAPGPISRTS